jgi:hypothetical protein
MGPNHVQMDRIHHDAVYPDGRPSTPGHLLLCQFSQRVAVLPGSSGGDRQCPFDCRIAGREEDPAIRLHGQNPITHSEMEPLCHFAPAAAQAQH